MVFSQSYANIAGVPAVFGLYGAFLPVLIYSLFGSCRQLGVGPVAVTSGLIFSGLNGVVPGHDKITDYNDPAPDQVSTQVRIETCLTACSVPKGPLLSRGCTPARGGQRLCRAVGQAIPNSTRCILPANIAPGIAWLQQPPMELYTICIMPTCI